MRMRTRTYAVAFAAGIAAATIREHQHKHKQSQQQHYSQLIVSVEALRSSSSPLLSPPPSAATRGITTIITIRRPNRDTSNNYWNNYASRTDADTDTDAETINISRKSYGAPVVDSTLLRFISEQKKVPDVFRESDDYSPLLPYQGVYSEGGYDAYDAYDSTTNAIKQKLTGEASAFVGDIGTNMDMNMDMNMNIDEMDDEDVNANDFILLNTMANIDANDESPTATSWMAQFGSKNVAQLLLDLGVDDASIAKTAGEAVERYCVVRTARRRIRKFLKERDTLWASAGDGSSSSRSMLESMAASDMATSPAASLLLSYAEQQRKRQKAEGEDDCDCEDGYDLEVAQPSYGLEDVLAVMREYGLTGNDISVLLTHSPNLALRVPRKSYLQKGKTDEAETLEETLERSLKGLLMSTLGLRRYDARKVLRTCPGLLSVRGSESAVQVVTIMTKLGVSESSLARDKTSLPVLLSRSPAGLFRLVAFLSSTAIRMDLEQIGPLLRRKVGRDLMDALLPVPNTSYSKIVANAAGNKIAEAAVIANATTTVFAATETDTEEAGATAAATTTTTTTLEDDAADWSRTRIQRQKRIERTYSGMTQTARILKAQIGTQDLSKVVSAYPNVLLLDAEKQILPVARYLMGGLGIWQNDLSGVLQLYPTILGNKIEDLERVVSYVLTLGVDEDDLAGIFRAFPGLFALQIEEMETVVGYLESIGVAEIGAFVTKLPPVLGYSVEKELRPKWEFLKTVTLQPEYELQQFPAYFSYPFDRVIKTRFNYLAYKGISIRFVSMRIDTVLRFGDVDFANKVALDDDRGKAFRWFASQKRSSSDKGLAVQQQRKKKQQQHNNSQEDKQQRNEAKAALAAAQRLSEDIDNAKNLAELNRIFRAAAPLRNRSLGNSLPSLKPSRPKRKPKRKNNATTHNKQQQRQQQGNNNFNRNRGRGDNDGAFPIPA